MDNNQNNEVEKFDPATLMNGVKDRIKATFVSLIPDEQWDQMCDVEMKKFFQPTYSGYNNQDKKPSEFEKIVTELMKEKCAAYVKELFSNPEYHIETLWEFNQGNGTGANKPKLSQHLDAMIKEKMPDMLSAMITNIMASSFHELFTNANRQLQVYR